MPCVHCTPAGGGPRKRKLTIPSRPLTATGNHYANTQAHCTYRACLNHPPKILLTRASTSRRSTGFCVILDCTSSSSTKRVLSSTPEANGLGYWAGALPCYGRAVGFVISMTQIGERAGYWVFVIGMINRIWRSRRRTALSALDSDCHKCPRFR